MLLNISIKVQNFKSYQFIQQSKSTVEHTYKNNTLTLIPFKFNTKLSNLKQGDNGPSETNYPINDVLSQEYQSKKDPNTNQNNQQATKQDQQLNEKEESKQDQSVQEKSQAQSKDQDQQSYEQKLEKILSHLKTEDLGKEWGLQIQDGKDNLIGKQDNDGIYDIEQLSKDIEMKSLIEQLLQLEVGKSKRGLIPQSQTSRKEVLKSFDLEGVADYIKERKPKNIIFMCGAGISVAAGIPDFRSPGSGLYHNLKKYNLPSPEAVFDIEYFRINPQAFYTLSKELAPESFKPTLTHYFINLAHQKNILQRCWSQNIDSLETKAGLPQDKLVACHGNYDGAHCISCKSEVPKTIIEKHLQDGQVCKCDVCDGYVKPDIIFYGETLPERFFKLSPSDFTKCDLLIIMGTSLLVHPFAGLIDRVNHECPRLLINREVVGENEFNGMGLDFSESNYRDAKYIGECDDGILKLSQLLGWDQDLLQMQKQVG